MTKENDDKAHQARKARVAAAAQRALAEAQARRQEIDARIAAMPEEKGARRKIEPVRYGDWELKGIATDF